MQLDDVVWDGLIGDLYDAVQQPDQLEAAIKRFEQVVQSDGCHLFVTDAQTNPLLHVWTLDWVDQQKVGADYYQHYIHLDPRRSLMLDARVGEALQCSQFYDERYVQRNEFYQDCLIPTGARYVAGGKVMEHQGMSGFAAFNRAKGRPDFNAQEMALIRRYMPHLARSLKLMVSHQQLHLSARAGGDALEQLGKGVVALSPSGRVLHADRLGTRYLPQLGLLKSHGLQLAPRIQSLVALAHATHRPQSLSWEAGPDDVVALMIWPAPPPTSAPSQFATTLGLSSELHTLLILKPMGAPGVCSPSTLMQLFGLTAAEARLAHALAGGASLDDCAQRFSVSINTVRTQLRGVLGKTACKRQADLVRLLVSLPGGSRPRHV